MKDPLLAPALALAGGILLSHAARFGLLETAVGASVFAVAAITLRLRARRLAFVAMLASVALAGTAIDVFHRPGKAPRIDANSRETVLLDGCVVEPSIFNQDHDQFTVELAPHARARVTVELREGETPPEVGYGRRVEVESRVRPIRNFQNPGSFDFVAYSARRQIYWTASARSPQAVRLLPGECGSTFMRAIFGLRTTALKRIDSLYSGDAYATGMMESILIGETSKLEKIWTDHFRRTGTFHALVISGLHIAVIAGTLLFLLRVCFMRELPALATTALVTWIYVLVAGSNPPAVRAAGAFTLYLIARYFYRRGRVMNLLAVVGILYLVIDPGLLFEASFQLSFLSVAAIGVLGAPIMERTTGLYRAAVRNIENKRRDQTLEPRAAQFRLELRLLAETVSMYARVPERWLLGLTAWLVRLLFFAFDLVVVSAVMQIGLALPMAIYFHRVSITGLSANVLIVPLLMLVVPIGFVAVSSGWMFAAHLAAWLLAFSEKIATWHIRWEPDWRIPNPPVWLAISFSIALIGLAFTMRRSRLWRRLALATVAVLFTLVFWEPFPPQVERGSLELTAIDVGQGDSLLVSFPDGKLMLVDGGGVLTFGRKMKPKLDTGEDVVSPYLWSRSIRRLDAIVATHGHEDHTGGLGAILDNFHPPELWTGANASDPVWLELAAHARRRGVKIVAMHAGQTFHFGGARIEVLSPPDDYKAKEKAANDDSLVFRVSYGERSFLLTGDMEMPMEARALGDGMPLRADVLKVGHHGSKTSTSNPFLDAVAPQLAIISDGFENSFGHPHRDVLARLAEHHAQVLRTDTVGMVTVRTDGKGIWVSEYR